MFYFCRINFQIVDEKYAGLSIFAFSFTMYCIVSLSLRRSRVGSFPSTYKLSTGEVRKVPRHSPRPWWCIASSAFKFEVIICVIITIIPKKNPIANLGVEIRYHNVLTFDRSIDRSIEREREREREREETSKSGLFFEQGLYAVLAIL